MTKRRVIPSSYHSNGCGCNKGLLRFVRPPFAEEFRAVCEWHDWRYHVCKGAEDRRAADKELLHGMLKRTAVLKPGACRAWLMVTTAVVCFCMVRVFGRFFINDYNLE